MTDTADLLTRLEAYYDTAPRATSDIEEHGPLTLFVAREGWPYYARPRLGGSDDVTADDVRAVLARQRELDVPRAVEWVHEVTPSLLAAAREAGMTVEECPLLVLDGQPAAKSADASVRLVGADDVDLGLVRAAVNVGFGTGGTAVGEASVGERDADAADHPEAGERLAAQIAAGRTVLVGAFDSAAGAVGGGSHNPRGEVTEIVGVGVLPAFRRRGIAAALSSALAAHARGSGVTTVFCGAQSEDVARVYEGVGFRRVGTACVAEAE